MNTCLTIVFSKYPSIFMEMVLTSTTCVEIFTTFKVFSERVKQSSFYASFTFDIVNVKD